MIWLHKGQIIQHHRGARWIFQFAAPLLTSKTTLGLRKAHLGWYRVHKRLPTRNEIFNDTKKSRRKGAPIVPQIGGSRSSVRKSPVDHPVQPPAGRPAVYLKSVVDRPGVRARCTSTGRRGGTLLLLLTRAYYCYLPGPTISLSSSYVLAMQLSV